MPIHIIRHGFKVMKVADLLACLLEAKGLELDRPLIRASAMLHDVAKMDALQAPSGPGHAELGAMLLADLGLVKEAEVVRQHVRLRRPVRAYGRPDEALVVNYADKRVMHTRIVSLETRFKDLFVRYGKSKEARQRLETMHLETQQMETLIYEVIEVKPAPAGQCSRNDTPLIDPVCSLNRLGAAAICG